jgi:hypothetical protein
MGEAIWRIGREFEGVPVEVEEANGEIWKDLEQT